MKQPDVYSNEGTMRSKNTEKQRLSIGTLHQRFNLFGEGRRAYWSQLTAFWGVYFIFLCVMHSGRMAVHFSRVAIWTILIVSTGFVMCLLMTLVYRRIPIERFRIWPHLILILLTTVVTANIWYGVDLFTDWIMRTEDVPSTPTTWKYYLHLTFYWEILLIAWSGFYFIMRFWNAWHREKSRAERIRILAKQSQLQMLRYQLNPHFLFNVLNSVRSLIDEDQKKAGEMITELSEFLQYSLTEASRLVPLREELEAARRYFSIEKKRYENKLDVRFNVDENAMDYPILSFLIHPILENAVKYGMRTSQMPLQIDIHAELVDGGLELTVSNSGMWMEKQPNTPFVSGTGTGLHNIRRQLETAYPDRYRFQVHGENDQVTVHLRLVDPSWEQTHVSAA